MKNTGREAVWVENHWARPFFLSDIDWHSQTFFRGGTTNYICLQVADCTDKSDETSCEMLSVTHDLYHKEYPPFLKDNADTEVNINLTIFSIGEIDEIKMSLSLHFLLSLEW